jgi:hypothetical protein
MKVNQMNDEKSIFSKAVVECLNDTDNNPDEMLNNMHLCMMTRKKRPFPGSLETFISVNVSFP